MDQIGLLSLKYVILKRDALGRLVEKETDSFVLSPCKDDTYGSASRTAIRSYAKRIRSTNPILAGDLERWVVRICRDIQAEHRERRKRAVQP